MEYKHVRQPFPPVFDQNAEILILGSFPSVKSRENGFYYGHSANRFWKVLAAVLGKDTPVTVEEKKRMLTESGVALWDVIEECDIKGSDDASIRNVTAADVPGLLQRTRVRHIFVNGKTAQRLYRRYLQPETGKEAVLLPSTSPANAAYSTEKLTTIWSAAIGGVRMEETERTATNVRMEETERTAASVRTENAGETAESICTENAEETAESSSTEDERTAVRMLTYEITLTAGDYRRFLHEAHFQEADMDECERVWMDFYGSDVREAKAQVRVWYMREAGEIDKITAVMTIGDTYDDMIVMYENKGELLKAYAADCYAGGVLRRAYALLGDQICQREGKYPGKLRFFDEAQMKEVPGLLKRMKIQEVSCNEAYVLTPQKTVVFMTEMSDEKNTDCGNICADCPKTDCPNRQKSRTVSAPVSVHAYRYGYQQILGQTITNIFNK